jgi:SAM-dependent methyltransferase
LRSAPIFQTKTELSDVIPKLKSYRFPEQLVTNRTANISEIRIREIEAALRGAAQAGVVQFRAPWLDATAIEDSAVDMLFSQAVLEHIDDLAGAYEAMRRWVKPGGFVSLWSTSRAMGVHGNGTAIGHIPI